MLLIFTFLGFNSNIRLIGKRFPNASLTHVISKYTDRPGDLWISTGGRVNRWAKIFSPTFLDIPGTHSHAVPGAYSQSGQTDCQCLYIQSMWQLCVFSRLTSSPTKLTIMANTLSQWISLPLKLNQTGLTWKNWLSVSIDKSLKHSFAFSGWWLVHSSRLVLSNLLHVDSHVTRSLLCGVIL